MVLPPSTNDQYAGARTSAWFLGLAALLTIGPALIHSFLPDGGAQTIAGLQLGASRDVVIGVFRWEGATQLALGLAMLAVALRYRTLVPLFLILLILEHGLMALQGWGAQPAVERPSSAGALRQPGDLAARRPLSRPRLAAGRPCCRARPRALDRREPLRGIGPSRKRSRGCSGAR
jgi:hypothetical protein